jgi:mannitol/fructose-specific phosphotransferase system IIA component (Ntr-type)
LVILSAIKGDKAGAEHLKMIASLSRKLVDDEFRARMTSEKTDSKMLSLLNSALKS